MSCDTPIRMLGLIAVGSLREEYRPRDLVLVDQIMDKTHRRAPTFLDDAMAVHVEFAQPYCAPLRQRLASTFFDAQRPALRSGAGGG